MKAVSTGDISGHIGQETQNVYDEKRKEKTKQWEAEVKTYMELPKWKARCSSPSIAVRAGVQKCSK